MIRLPLWAYVAVFAALCLLFGVVQTHRLKADKAAHSAFRADVKAKGEQAIKDAARQIAADQRNKERTDAENAKLRTTNAALSRSLRNARTAGGYVPPASPGSLHPDLACFDRTELERAIGQLDAGLSGLAEKGDAFRIDLDSARDWVKAR